MVLILLKSMPAFASGQEKAVHLIDLREMHSKRRLAFGKGRKALAQSGLDNMRGAVLQRGDGGDAWRRD